MEKPIGIFDSGIGGLTVYKALKSLLPNENFIYLGDTARVPYGTKSRETVARYSIQNALYLMEQGIKALVVACNTASAYGLNTLTSHFRVPVIGVIEPGARASVLVTRTNNIGVIGTEGTIRSRAYHEAIRKINPDIHISATSCPLLVALAEEGWVSGEVVDLVLEKYLSSFSGLDNPIDTLILGCTHYPLFIETIRKKMGSSVTIVDSAVETAKTLKKILEGSGLLNTSYSKGTSVFFSTDAPDRMQQIGHWFLGEDLKQVSKIDLSGF